MVVQGKVTGEPNRAVVAEVAAKLSHASHLRDMQLLFLTSISYFQPRAVLELR